MKFEFSEIIQKRLLITSAIAGFLLLAIAPSPLSAQTAVGIDGVQALPPYNISIFAQSVPGQFTKPDSIAYNADGIYIGYGDGHAPDGSDGKSSQIVQYDYTGTIQRVIQVKGHNDGLKVNPTTFELWAMQNEDANARLEIFNTKTWAYRLYVLGTGQHGGGYDDIVFLGGKTYFSASNPANNPNSEPAIVEFKENNGSFTLTPVLMGNAPATDITTGKPVLLNLQDPDSMTVNLAGDIVITSQADGELIVVHNPTSLDQSVYRLPLAVNGQMTTVDDTAFPIYGTGYMLVSDTAGETVYKITKPFFSAGSALSASDTGGFVGELDFNTGNLRPVLTGFSSPHGMVFFPTGLTIGSFSSRK